MNSLRRKIKLLEEDIEQRKCLVAQSTFDVKSKVQEAVISPVAFGIAFLSGILLTLRRKKRVAKKTNSQQSKISASGVLSIFSELSSVLMLVKYAQKFFKQNELTR